MDLSGDLLGENQAEEPSEPAAEGPEADAAPDAPSDLPAPSSVGRNFQGVFSGRINTWAPRLAFLTAGAALWTTCCVTISKAFFLAFSPLAALQVSLTDADWSDVADLKWEAVPWIVVVIWVIAAAAAGGLGYLSMRKWRKLRRLRKGIVGEGIRVLPDGAVELGAIKIRPSSLRGVSATGRGRIESVRWRRLGRYAEEREILINILRNAKGDLTVGHILLKTARGKEVMFLEFIKNRFAKQSTLWVAGESEILWLNRVALDAQLETVSSVLAPIAQRDGGLLTLTLTEVAPDAREAASKGAAFGVIKGAAARSMPVSATNSLQAQANKQLAAGKLPEALRSLAGVVDKYSYKLKPNLDAKRLRGW
jgi:hypothetical protein